MSRRVIQGLMITAAAAALVTWTAGRAEVQSRGKLVYRKSSLYYNIFVFQNGPVRTLQFGNRPLTPIQSQVDFRDFRKHLLGYTELSFCGLLYSDRFLDNLRVHDMIRRQQI